MGIEILSYEAGPGLGIKFPTKTIITEENSRIIMISPHDLSRERLEQIRKKNKKISIVSPNNFHNLYLSKMKDEFKNASFYGPRRSSIQSGVELKEAKELITEDLKVIQIRGCDALSESCFFHVPTSTLIVTDLFFNIKTNTNLSTKIMMKLVGTDKKLATSKVIKHQIKDKAIFKESLIELQNLTPINIIPSHGDQVDAIQFNKWVATFM